MVGITPFGWHLELSPGSSMVRTDTRTRTRRFIVALTLIVGLLGARRAAADTLTLTWDFNSEPDVNGYIVYIGTQPGVYAQSVDVHNTNTYAFTSAQPGRRYYFAVAAYAGTLLSPLSQEVSGISNQGITGGTDTSDAGTAISRAIVRHSSSTASDTGTIAIARPPDPVEITRTVVRSPMGATPAQQSGSTPGSVPPVVYTGSSATTRSASTQTSPVSGTYTGTTAMSRPSLSTGGSIGGPGMTSGSTTQSIARDPATQGLVDDSNTLAVPADDAGSIVGSPTTAELRTAVATAPTSAPTVRIETPVSEATFAAGTPIVFSGIAQDAEDGNISSRIVWTSSIEGRLGTGALVSKTLAAGTHTITASATDNKGNTRTAQVTIVVN
jgi:hypothetical protein